MLQVLLPLILQKPSLKSKKREHVKYLNKRMEWWKHGKLEELISECEAIQKGLKRSVKTKQQSDQKAFCRLMLQGQVKKSLKVVNHASDIDGKHDITTSVPSKIFVSRLVSKICRQYQKKLRCPLEIFLKCIHFKQKHFSSTILGE